METPVLSRIEATATVKTTKPSTDHHRPLSSTSFAATTARNVDQSILVPKPSRASQSFPQTSHNHVDTMHSPSTSEGSNGNGNTSQPDSSQESQLMRLSQLAATRERIPDDRETGATQAKRMADGYIKHRRTASSVSPVRNAARGHSRNPSAISMASTNGSRIGELSAELKTKLSYAMIKVTNGWQSHTIDQVESLASQAASPTSTSSAMHRRNGSSASPQLSASLRSSNNSTPATLIPQLSHPSWVGGLPTQSRGSPNSPVKSTPGLAPPISMEPSKPIAHPRRSSNARHAPPSISLSQQASPNVGPRTPGQPSPYYGSPRSARTPGADPIVFSPHQNVREQDAIESLLFMSSPGNSANLKHTFSSSQPLPGGRPVRTALPTSQPRKSLPNGRPSHMGPSQSQPQKRVGFETTLHEAEDRSYLSPNMRTPKRRTDGQVRLGQDADATTPRSRQLHAPAGLTASTRPRPRLRDEDIDRMLDHADDSSDSDGEIHIPVSRTHQERAYIGA